MTDPSSSHKTHIAPVVDSIAGLGSGLTSGKLAHASKSTDLPIDDEEDYTIKCICGFQDDDGNTVFCERCETWQHILCYYFRDGIVLDVKELDHSCADCEPRPLDAQGATERQSRRRDDLDPRKVKKTTTKSHKKKAKVLDSNPTLTNGWSHDKNDVLDRTSRSPRDPLPPSKKPKSNHRPSGSINFPPVALNSNPQTFHSSGSSSRNLHNPTQPFNNHLTDGYPSDAYSLEFLHLYDNDPGDNPMQANFFNDITITRSLSSWSHDVESLREAANGLSPQDVFHRCDQPLDSMPLPHLHKGYKQDTTLEVEGRHPRWNFLTIDSLTPKDSIVGELKGKIGHMQDYVQDPTNRWDYLRHPVPFVFFHPKLPIYIDTRCEGTTCRYLRRSCRPNLSMKTFLENGSDYHFCFVAKHDLEAGTELTIGWVLDQHIRNFFHHRRSDEMKKEGVDAEEDYVADWVGKVLADFGGCACDVPSQCSLAKYDRRNGRSAHNASRHLSNGKSSKGRNGYINKTSPPSTGYATNSRASSEVLKHLDDDENDDNRSASGSTRSKPRSRDMTPTYRTSRETGFAPGVPLSDRDKRKIAALEKNFEQLEQDRQQPAPKKKKRNSGGSNLNTPTASTSRQIGQTATSLSQPNTPGFTIKPHHTDASTSRQRSASPIIQSFHPTLAPNNMPSAHFPKKPSQRNMSPINSSLGRQNYVDSTTQTDLPRKDDWYEPTTSPNPVQRRHVSLKKRLLIQCQRDHKRLEIQLKQIPCILNKTPNSTSIIPCSKITQEPAPLDSTATALAYTSKDSEMPDVEYKSVSDIELSPSNAPVQKPRPPDELHTDSESTIVLETKPPPPMWPSQTAPPSAIHSRPINGYHAPELRVLLPPTPQFSNETALDPSAVITPSSVLIPPGSVSPFTQPPNIYPPASTNNSSALVQQSPVKKKITLDEYIRKNKSESLSAPEKNIGSIPISSQNIPKVVNLDGEVKALPAGGGVTAHASNKEDNDSLRAGKDSML